MQRGAKFGVDQMESGHLHLADFLRCGVHLAQQRTKAVKSVAVHLLDSHLQARLGKRMRQQIHFLGQVARVKGVPNGLKKPGVHRLDGTDFAAPTLKVLLLARDALAHLLQHSAALAPQAVEFGALLGQTTLARLNHAPHFGAQGRNVLRDGSVQHRAAPADHALGQSRLQR